MGSAGIREFRVNDEGIEAEKDTPEIDFTDSFAFIGRDFFFFGNLIIFGDDAEASAGEAGIAAQRFFFSGDELFFGGFLVIEDGGIDDGIAKFGKNEGYFSLRAELRWGVREDFCDVGHDEFLECLEGGHACFFKKGLHGSLGEAINGHEIGTMFSDFLGDVIFLAAGEFRFEEGLIGF